MARGPVQTSHDEMDAGMEHVLRGVAQTLDIDVDSGPSSDAVHYGGPIRGRGERAPPARAPVPKANLLHGMFDPPSLSAGGEKAGPSVGSSSRGGAAPKFSGARGGLHQGGMSGAEFFDGRKPARVESGPAGSTPARGGAAGPVSRTPAPAPSASVPPSSSTAAFDSLFDNLDRGGVHAGSGRGGRGGRGGTSAARGAAPSRGRGGGRGGNTNVRRPSYEPEEAHHNLAPPPGMSHGWRCASCSFANPVHFEVCMVCADGKKFSVSQSEEVFPVQQPAPAARESAKGSQSSSGGLGPGVPFASASYAQHPPPAPAPAPAPVHANAAAQVMELLNIRPSGRQEAVYVQPQAPFSFARSTAHGNGQEDGDFVGEDDEGSIDDEYNDEEEPGRGDGDREPSRAHAQSRAQAQPQVHQPTAQQWHGRASGTAATPVQRPVREAVYQPAPAPAPAPAARAPARALAPAPAIAPGPPLKSAMKQGHEKAQQLHAQQVQQHLSVLASFQMPAEGHWACTSCSFHNVQEIPECEMCGGKRPSMSLDLGREREAARAYAASEQLAAALAREEAATVAERHRRRRTEEEAKPAQGKKGKGQEGREDTKHAPALPTPAPAPAPRALVTSFAVLHVEGEEEEDSAVVVPLDTEQEDGEGDKGAGALSAEAKAARKAAKKARLEEAKEKEAEKEAQEIAAMLAAREAAAERARAKREAEIQAAAKAKHEAELKAAAARVAEAERLAVKDAEKAALLAEKKARAEAEAEARKREEAAARAAVEAAKEKRQAEAKAAAAKEAAVAAAAAAAKANVGASAPAGGTPVLPKPAVTPGFFNKGPKSSPGKSIQYRQAIPVPRSDYIGPAGAKVREEVWAEVLLPNGSIVAGFVYKHEARAGPKALPGYQLSTRRCKRTADPPSKRKEYWHVEAGGAGAWFLRSLAPQVDTSEAVDARPRVMQAWLINEVRYTPESDRRYFPIPKKLEGLEERRFLVALSDGSMVVVKCVRTDCGAGSALPPSLHCVTLGKRGVSCDVDQAPAILQGGSTLAAGEPILVPVTRLVLPKVDILINDDLPALPWSLDALARGFDASGKRKLTLDHDGVVPRDKILPAFEWVAIPMRVRPMHESVQSHSYAHNVGATVSELWVARVLSYNPSNGMHYVHSGSQGCHVDLSKTGALWLRADCRPPPGQAKNGGYFPVEVHGTEDVRLSERPTQGVYPTGNRPISMNVVQFALYVGLSELTTGHAFAPGAPVAVDDQDGVILAGCVRTYDDNIGLYEILVPGEEVARLAAVLKPAAAESAAKRRTAPEAFLPAPSTLATAPGGYDDRVYYVSGSYSVARPPGLSLYARAGQVYPISELDDQEHGGSFQETGARLAKRMPPTDGATPPGALAVGTWAITAVPPGTLAIFGPSSWGYFVGRVSNRSAGEEGKYYYVLTAPVAPGDQSEAASVEVPGRYVASLPLCLPIVPVLTPLGAESGDAGGGKGGRASGPMMLPLGPRHANELGLQGPAMASRGVRVVCWRPEAGAWLTGCLDGMAGVEEAVGGGGKAWKKTAHVVKWDPCAAVQAATVFERMRAVACGESPPAHPFPLVPFDQFAESRMIDNILADSALYIGFDS